MAVETSELVDSDPPTEVPVAGAEAGADVSAAVAVCGVELALDGCGAVVVWVTDEVPCVDGEGTVVLVTPGFTTAAGAGAGAVVEVTDMRTDSGAFEPPLPTEGTVVVGDGATVVLVTAGAAVVGGVAGATVVTGALLAAVPWDWVPAGWEAGAVWAEAGRAFSTRKSPARSARAAAHLRGLTTSFPALLLIGLNRPPWLGRGMRGREATAGTREVNHGGDGADKRQKGL